MGESSLKVRPPEKDDHPLSPALFPPPRRSASFTVSTASSSAPQTSYFDLNPHNLSSTREHNRGRHHAASISVVPPRVAGKGRVSQADLLGVGPSRRPRSIVEPVNENNDDGDISPGQEIPLSKTQSREKRSNRLSISSTRPVYVDSLSKEDAAVLEMRFDMMTDEELGIYLSTLFPLPTSSSDSGVQSRIGSRTTSSESVKTPIPPQPPEDSTETPRAPRYRKLTKFTWSDDDQSPLFPPSPPSDAPRGQPDHPLRVLAKAVREMREKIESLEEENERLRNEISLGRAKKSRDKAADEVSVMSVPSGLSTDTRPRYMMV